MLGTEISFLTTLLDIIGKIGNLEFNSKFVFLNI